MAIETLTTDKGKIRLDLSSDNRGGRFIFKDGKSEVGNGSYILEGTHISVKEMTLREGYGELGLQDKAMQAIRRNHPGFSEFHC